MSVRGVEELVDMWAATVAFVVWQVREWRWVLLKRMCEGGEGGFLDRYGLKDLVHKDQRLVKDAIKKR